MKIEIKDTFAGRLNGLPFLSVTGKCYGSIRKGDVLYHGSDYLRFGDIAMLSTREPISLEFTTFTAESNLQADELVGLTFEA